MHTGGENADAGPGRSNGVLDSTHGAESSMVRRAAAACSCSAAAATSASACMKAAWQAWNICLASCRRAAAAGRLPSTVAHSKARANAGGVGTGSGLLWWASCLSAAPLGRPRVLRLRLRLLLRLPLRPLLRLLPLLLRLLRRLRPRPLLRLLLLLRLRLLLRLGLRVRPRLRSRLRLRARLQDGVHQRWRRV